MFSIDIPEWVVVLRLAMAVAAGGVLGWERESRHKPAGFRTMMMIAVGSAIFTLANLAIYQTSLAADPQTRTDASRIIQGVAGGIGFLGAGSIIRSGGTVDGMTTASTIWLVGGLGVCCGAGAYSLAAIGMAFGLFVLVGMRVIERRIPRRREE